MKPTVLFFFALIILSGLMAQEDFHDDVDLHDPFNSDYDLNPQGSMNTTSSNPSWIFRPGLYFGLKPKTWSPLNFGLAWTSFQPVQKTGGRPLTLEFLRHQAEERDSTIFSWLMTDGRSFGIQQIKDPKYKLALTVYFLQEGDHWIVRVEATGKPSVDRTYCFVHYWGLEDNDGESYVMLDTATQIDALKGIEGDQILLEGQTKRLGEFAISMTRSITPLETEHFSSEKYPNLLRDLQHTHVSGVQMDAQDVWKASHVFVDELRDDHIRMLTVVEKEMQKAQLERQQPDIPKWILPSLSDRVDDAANVLLFQDYSNLPFSYEITFVDLESANYNAAQVSDKLSRSLDQKLEAHKVEFHQKFLEHFPKFSEFSKEKIEFGISTLSNLIGGMGYWSGKGLVKNGDKVTPGPDSTLFSAVPSRSFFPRGFLWDEGFHQLLISQWDLKTSKEVLQSWFGLMNADGWIAREQILGDEARYRVPAEFQVQDPTFANPPTFLFLLNFLSQVPDQKEFLTKIYRKFQKNYDWFTNTQTGILENSFRWRGRTENHTLCSGLDDYPRAKQPSEYEVHLDLISWMAFYAQVLSRVAETLHIKADGHQAKYEVFREKILNEYWSEADQAFCDFNFNTTAPAGEEKEFICHKGYVTLFPFLLGFIPKDDPKLLKILELIHDPDELWTPYGIRSLSKQDAYYGTGENYWKGPIWMNMNYLVLSSLSKNYLAEGPYAAKAAEIYQELRHNLIENLFKVYQKTGYIWEQYSSKDGKGKRTHPFNGWSSLIVLIMAESYP